MKSFSNCKKIALIFAIIVIFACTVIIAVTYNGETEIYKTPIID